MSDQVIDGYEIANRFEIKKKAHGYDLLINDKIFPYHISADRPPVYQPGCGETFGELTITLVLDDFEGTKIQGQVPQPAVTELWQLYRRFRGVVPEVSDPEPDEPWWVGNPQAEATIERLKVHAANGSENAKRVLRDHGVSV